MNRSVIGFLSFVIALVLGVGFVWPKAMEVKNLGAEEQARLQLNTSRETRLAALNDLKTVFASNAKLVSSVVAVLPQTPQIPETLVSIEAMARDNGVSIQSLSPQVDSRKQVVSVTVNGDGDLNAIEGFLKAIADNNRPISLTTVSMVRSTDGKKISVSLGLEFPYKETPKGVAP